MYLFLRCSVLPRTFERFPPKSRTKTVCQCSCTRTGRDHLLGHVLERRTSQPVGRILSIEHPRADCQQGANLNSSLASLRGNLRHSMTLSVPTSAQFSLLPCRCLRMK